MREGELRVAGPSREQHSGQPGREQDGRQEGLDSDGRHAWQLATRRCVRRGYDTIRSLGSELDVEYVQMFGELDFVAAVADSAGFWGWTGRAATMRYLFGDLLPRAVLEHRTKAVFNNAVFTEHTREFAWQWDGRGVDPDLVDPEALRANWLSDFPHAPSMALLQQASDLRKLSSGKPLTSYIAQAELCKSRLNSASYLLTGQFNM